MAFAFSFYDLFIFLSFTIFISLPCLAINPTVTSPKHKGFSVDLIHRDSPLSPLYNPKSNFWDKAERLYETSVARYAYIASNTSEKYRSDASVDAFVYFAKLSFGTPSVDVFVVIDSGSDLLWIQCKPCTNCQPIYDRTQSSTYQNVSCNSPACKVDTQMQCDSNNACLYSIKYVDKSYTNGLLAAESVTFMSNGAKDTVFNVPFGCGIDNYNTYKGQMGGVLGLAPTQLSLVSTIGSISQPKFSYCLGNASDPSSIGNLIIGQDAHISGSTTPFTVDYFYKVFPVGIKVGTQSLDISPGAFGDVILDSGAIFSFMPPEVHNKLTNAISEAMKGFNAQPSPPPRDGLLCYTGNIGRDLNGFPTMTIQFQEHATLILERWSIFIQDKEKFCLSFGPIVPGVNKRSVIGSTAQQFYNFGFDFATKQLSIVHSPCIY